MMVFKDRIREMWGAVTRSDPVLVLTLSGVVLVLLVLLWHGV